MMWLVHRRMPDLAVVGVWSDFDQATYFQGQERQRNEALDTISDNPSNVPWPEWAQALAHRTPTWAYWETYITNDRTGIEVLEEVADLR